MALRSRPRPPRGNDWRALILFDIGGRPLAARANNNFQVVRRAGAVYDYYPLDIHVHRVTNFDITPLDDRGAWLGLLSSPSNTALPIVDSAIVCGRKASSPAQEFLLETSISRGGRTYALLMPVDRITGEVKQPADRLSDHVLIESPSQRLTDADWHALEER